MLLPAVPGTLTKQHAVSSISRQERIIFHPLVSVGNISLKNTPDFSCSCGITHFRHVPFSNSHLLHFRKFLSFSPSPFSPSPSPLCPPSHSVFLSFSLFFNTASNSGNQPASPRRERQLFRLESRFSFIYHHSLS